LSATSHIKAISGDLGLSLSLHLLELDSGIKWSSESSLSIFLLARTHDTMRCEQTLSQIVLIETTKDKEGE
jgi:hypothetical protein